MYKLINDTKVQQIGFTLFPDIAGGSRVAFQKGVKDNNNLVSLLVSQNNIISERCRKSNPDSIYIEVFHEKNEETNLFDIYLVVRIPTVQNNYAEIIKLDSIYPVQQNLILYGIFEHNCDFEVWGYNNSKKQFSYVRPVNNIKIFNNGFLGKIPELNLPNILVCDSCGKLINKIENSNLCTDCLSKKQSLRIIK